MSGVTWSSTVASTTVPVRLPPATSLAPLATASAISSSIFSAAWLLISEPSTTWPRGSPAGSFEARAASLATNSSAIFSSTISRSVDMQIWPWFMKAPNTAALTAPSMSASSSTTSGALPPSSSSTGFRCRPASSAMIRPTLVEPVKLMRLTAGCATSASTIAAASLGSLVMTLMTPFGRPASASAWPISRCVPGHISEAFSTTVLPQASGMATARVPRMTGAFHGAMPTQTPAAWRIAHGQRARLVGRDDLARDLRRHRRRLAQHVGRQHDVEAGPGRGGAGLLDHQPGEFADLGGQHVGRLEQQRAPLARPGLRPCRKGGGRGGDRGLDVGQPARRRRASPSCR